MQAEDIAHPRLDPERFEVPFMAALSHRWVVGVGVGIEVQRAHRGCCWATNSSCRSSHAWSLSRFTRPTSSAGLALGSHQSPDARPLPPPTFGPRPVLTSI